MAVNKSKLAQWWAQNNSLVVGVGSTIAMSYVGYKLMQSLGVIDDKETREQQKEQEKSTEDYEKELKETMKATQSEGYWLTVADGIYEALKYSSISDDKTRAEQLLKQPKNNLDLHLLIKMYGSRQHYFFGIPEGGKRTLPQHLATGELSAKAIDRINAVYANNGMTVKW